jgi:DNA topoisomerase-1
LTLLKLLPKQHFTEPPPRFTEATLVKGLEEQGIGGRPPMRPSSRRSRIAGYVELTEREVPGRPSSGFVVTDLPSSTFPTFRSPFTAGMEDRSPVERGSKDWVALMRQFYDPFA